MISLTENTC